MRSWRLPDSQPRRPGRVQRPGEHHLDDLAPLLKRLPPFLDRLGTLSGTRLAAWRAGAHGWLTLAETGEAELPPWPPRAGPVVLGGRSARLEDVGGVPGLWLTVAATGDVLPAAVADIVTIAARLACTEYQAHLLSDELTRRYEEIDLLYGISELLGRNIGLEEAAALIVREVSDVVGARRASIMVHDAEADVLRTVAAQGFDAADATPVAVADAHSVAARVFREQHPQADPLPEGSAMPGRTYRGESFLSVPIRYAAPGGTARCVGVINLTDRTGGEVFSETQLRLVEAIAGQIGSAIENARLTAHERQEQRLRRELELAHDLQRRLLPLPEVLAGEALVAVHFDPAESVGGDFYTFSRLGLGCVGVMLGDVSSHGFAAALVMAVVLSAAGIHAPTSVTPDETLIAMRNSLAQNLSSTDSYLTVFHGILDPLNRQLTYASAGHPQAFRIPRTGPPERLETTAPPLGLALDAPIASRQVAWVPGEDLLCLWTDGVVDAVGADGARYGEARLLDQLSAARGLAPEEILARVVADADAFARHPDDDRTLLILRI